MRYKGFTLVELMTSLAIAMIVAGILVTTYLTTQRIWKGGFSQITIQSQGRIALDKITKNIRAAIDANILDGGNRLQFVIDPNRTISISTDDISCEYYISGTNIMYDPDTSVSGNEVVMLRNVYQEGSIPFFQLSGNLAVITFRVSLSDVLYGAALTHFTTSINIRNMK